MSDATQREVEISLSSEKSTKRGYRYWRNLLVVFLVGLLLALLSLTYGVFPSLYARAVAHPARSPVCCTTPADRGLAYEEVSFSSADALTLYGWYLPTRNGAAVIVAHGIGGNRLGHLEQGAALARHGYGVLLLDQRAHGQSEGDTITFGGEDIVGAATYLQGRPDVGPDQIGAWGFSLGGLAVIQAAASTSAIQAIVADGPSPGVLRDMAPPESRDGWVWVPFNWAWYQFLKLYGVAAPTPAIEALPRIAPRPILLIAGAGQRTEQQRLQRFYAAAAGAATLWEIPEAGHLGGWAARPAEYEARVVAFFDRALLSSQ
jgi:pimeloyl-ACP methyl ester carboxylesterase